MYSVTHPRLGFVQVGQGRRAPPPASGTQSVGTEAADAEEEATIAVNAWFDMAYDGPTFAYYCALRAALGLA